MLLSIWEDQVLRRLGH